MVRTVINTDKAPAAIGPYSQAVRAGDLLFCAGQVAIDPGTNEWLGGTIEEQSEQVLKNLGGVLEGAGLSYSDVVKTTVFLSDFNDFVSFNRVYATYFPTLPPARSTVEVSRLPKDALVEIEAIAHFLKNK